MLSSFIQRLQTATKSNHLDWINLIQRIILASDEFTFPSVKNAAWWRPALLLLAVKPLADPLWDQDKKFLKSICDNFSSVVILKSINSCFTLYTWSVSAAARHKNLHASNNCEREIKSGASTGSWIYFGVEIEWITLTRLRWIKMSHEFIGQGLALEHESKSKSRSSIYRVIVLFLLLVIWGPLC